VIMESIILERLLAEHDTLLEEVDVFAGTSAGGILALGLAAGLKNDEASKFYQEDVEKVFCHSWLRDFETMGHTLAAHYTNEGLKEVLQKQFGDAKLCDLKKKVFVPSFQLDSNEAGHRRWVPRFFHNLGDQSPSNEERVVDVAMRTTAAPTYFPIYQGYVDGGIFANNPALCAVTTAIAAGINIKDIVVLSLSSGRDGLYISSTKYGDGDWGLSQWAPHLADMLLDSSQEVTDFQCIHLLGSKYQRIDPILPKEIYLDSNKDYALLIDIAKNVDLTSTLQWIKEVWLDGPELHPHMTLSPTSFPGVPPSALTLSPSKSSWSGWCSIQ